MCSLPGSNFLLDGPLAPNHHPRMYDLTAMYQHRATLLNGWSFDVAAGVGWTARDAWWALTRDPLIWGEYLPRATALVLAVGGMDALPAAIPTYLRQGIAYIRPGWVRRKVRAAYLEVSPRIIAATGGYSSAPGVRLHSPPCR